MILMLHSDKCFVRGQSTVEDAYKNGPSNEVKQEYLNDFEKWKTQNGYK